MITKQIKFSDIQDVYAFVAEATKFEGEIDLISGRYRVNAKSIMGIFSLDLLSPLTMEIDSGNADAFLAAVAKYII